MAGITIPLAADVTKFLRGTRDVERGLDDVAGAVDDVARDGDRFTDKLDRNFRDLTRKAKVMGDDIGDAARKGFREAEDHADRFKRSASDATDEFKDEATSNFSEVASSFNGDMTSAVDLVQGTLGGLAGSIPGFGLALGALGAVGGAVAQQWVESTEETKQAVSDMYDDMLASGANYLSEEYQQQLYWEILKGESKRVSLKNVQDIARWSMTSDAEVAMAYAGNQRAMTSVTEGLIAKRAEFQRQLEDEIDTNDSAAEAGITYVEQMIDGIQRRRAEIEETTATLDRQRDAWNEAHDTANARISSTIGEYQRMQAEMSKVTPPVIKPTVDLSDARRTLRAFTDGTYQVAVNGRVTGMRYE